MVSQCESYYLRDTEIRVNLKPCVLESVKYGTNGCIFSVLDNSEKKSSCLWYYWFLMYSFFPISFFLSQMDTNHIYCWTAKFLLENPAVDWNHSGWTKFPPCWLLLNEPLPTPPNLPLWPIKNLPPCVLLLSTPLPLSLADFRKSHGRVLGGRRLLYACEKEQSVSAESSTTAVLQNMYIPGLSSRLVLVPVDLEIIPYY